jgi:aspartate kinase
MQVFKFGGASVKDAESVKNVQEIIANFPNEKILVVVSAMGKMTNKFEELVAASLAKNEEQRMGVLSEIQAYHSTIASALFEEDEREFWGQMDTMMRELIQVCDKIHSIPEAMAYDAVVPYGELLSTHIVSYYIGKFQETAWIDASSIVKTDDKFKRATVDMTKTEKAIVSEVLPLFSQIDLVVTQGFIGSTTKNFRTTLGREGSDYSGAIFAYCLQASGLTIWKDVAGMYNADPKVFPKAQKIEQVSYKDAIELSYYGASVIHPKTIQPLQNKNIPLFVKSFLNPEESGTVIQKNAQQVLPCYIVKNDQVLVSLSSKDFSFIAEKHLSEIFEAFDSLDMKINIMQNSAVNFSAIFDAKNFDEKRVIEKFGSSYQVRYNTGLELITIRHYNDSIVKELLEQKEVLLEQRTRETVRFVVR